MLGLFPVAAGRVPLLPADGPSEKGLLEELLAGVLTGNRILLPVEIPAAVPLIELAVLTVPLAERPLLDSVERAVALTVPFK